MLLQFAAKLARTRPVLAARRKQLCLLFSQQYSSAISSVSPELCQKIADNIRAYEGRAVSWFDLVTKYKLPQSQLEEIFAYDEAERLKRQELSAKVTSVAQQTYHNGRCDWEAVAQEFAMPLLECLELYDAAQSSISPRLFPKLVDWPDKELQLLRQFVNKHFEYMTVNEWKLVGIYMNVNQTDCISACAILSRKIMTAEVAELIAKYREAGLKWKDIHLRIPLYASHVALSRNYHCYERKLRSPPNAEIKPTGWIEAETSRVRELVQKHYRPGFFRSVVYIVEAEFPEKTKEQVKAKVRSCTYKSYITQDDMDRVKRLVDKYGEDWDRIAQKLWITTYRAQRIWAAYQRQSKYTLNWTDSELVLLRECVQKGLDFADISKQLSTKSANACRHKWRLLQAREAAGKGAKYGALWTSEEIEKLQNLLYSKDSNWVEVSQKLNRTVSSCMHAYDRYIKSKRLKTSAEYTEVVSRAVREQYHKHKRVDWEQISTAVGLSRRECLEANEFNEGKARWEYDPETLSQEMADRMTQFIETTYPYPVPVNYQAVSNYMWIDKADCYKMAKQLDGDIEWTQELKERVVALRKQGMTYRVIAKQVGLSRGYKRVKYAYNRSTSPYVAESLSADDKAEVKELVYQNAERMSVADLRSYASGKLSHLQSYAVKRLVMAYAKGHPAYKSRVEENKAEIYNRTLNGAKSKDIAADLGVPSPLIQNAVKQKIAEGSSPVWTDEETKQLKEYVNSTSPPYRWERFSEFLGTKSVPQCKTKYRLVFKAS